MPSLGTHQPPFGCSGFLPLSLPPHLLPHACDLVDIPLFHISSLPNTLQHLLPASFLDQPNQGHLKLLFLSPIALLGGYMGTQRFHSFPRVSQWELRFNLPFPSCFLYNLKFPASQSLCLPPAFTLVSCSAYSMLKPSETSVDFQWTTQHYIPEHSTLHVTRKFENFHQFSWWKVNQRDQNI
jgi:hypothetical protein